MGKRRTFRKTVIEKMINGIVSLHSQDMSHEKLHTVL
jgi:hypothetical protein